MGVGATRRAGHFHVWEAIALVVAAVVATAVLVAGGSSLSFFFDDWYFLLQRPGWTADALLVSHNGHLSLLTAVEMKVLVSMFGLTGQVPFRLALAAAVVALGIVVHRWVRARVGPALGLAAATLVMLLGTAWENLWVNSAISLIASVAFGSGAVLVLDRDTPRRNGAACALLVLSILSTSFGLTAMAGAAVVIALRRRLAQAWIVGVPLAVYVAWLVTYGNDVGYSLKAGTGVSGENLRDLPVYVAESAAVGVASLFGANRDAFGSPVVAGAVLLAVLVVAAIPVVRRTGRPSPRVLAPVAMLLTYWVLTGLSYIPGREPNASRYQLVNVVLLLVILAELAAPLKIGRRARIVVLGVAAASLVSQVGILHGSRGPMWRHAQYAKAETGALELGRDRVSDDFRLSQTPAEDPYLSGVTARRYFEETDRHGSPGAWSVEQIVAAEPPFRRAADAVLARGYAMVSAIRPAPPGSGCDELPAGREVPLEPGRYRLTGARTGLAVHVRRFAPARSAVPAGLMSREVGVQVRVPPDSASQRWWLSITGGAARICRG